MLMDTQQERPKSRVSELKPINITAPQGQLHTNGGSREVKIEKDTLIW